MVILMNEKLNKNYMKNISNQIEQIQELILDMSYDYLRRIESLNDDVKSCSLKLLIKFSILYNKPLDDFIKD